MGILSKLMFWKKGEEDLGDLGLGGDMGLGSEGLGLEKDMTGLEGAGMGKPGELPGFGEKEHTEGINQPLGASPEAPKTQEVGGQYPSYDAQASPDYGAPAQPAAPAPVMRQPRHDIMVGKELELISTKLDSLKISLDSLNMRLASLERIAKGEYEKTW